MTAFRWTTQRETAARLLADDFLSDEQIASECGVSRQTLATWKKDPAFIQRVSEHLDATREAVKAAGVAHRQNRIDAYNDRWYRMRRIIDERAADNASGTFEFTKDDDGGTERLIAPGWTTGLLVRTEKQIGAGERSVRVVEFAVDTGLLKELRAHEEQAAKELGQWVEKQEHSGKDGGPIEITTIVIERPDEP